MTTRTKFTLTPSPNPSWKIRDGCNPDPEWDEMIRGGWKTWDFQGEEGVDPTETYRLLTSAIVPRPIAFVSSLSKDGVPNLAPFSYFSMVGHNPPLLSISFSLSTRKPKDTRENILATKEFTVNIISEPFVEAANASSVEAPEEISEWDVVGLKGVGSKTVKPARVLESAVSFECELYHSQDIYPPNKSPEDPNVAPTTTFILGLIKHAHIREAVLDEKTGFKTVDPAKLRAVSRLGGLGYAKVSEGFELERPSWREMKGEFGKGKEKEE